MKQTEHPRSDERGFVHDKNYIWIFLLFFISRTIFTFLGNHFLMSPKYSHNRLDVYEWNYTKTPFLNVWGGWDTGWYLQIAEEGYKAVPTFENQYNYVFFHFTQY